MKKGPKPQNELSRFESKINKSGPLWSGSPCWEWEGTTHNNGYGLFDRKINGKWKKCWAHRVSYESYVRLLLPRETVDHLCCNHSCVNPSHLDGCSSGENSRRSPITLQGSNARKTHCPAGHPYSGDNLFYDDGKRRCRTCVREKNRKARVRRAGEKLAACR